MLTWTYNTQRDKEGQETAYSRVALYGFGWGSLEGLVTSHVTAATRGMRWKKQIRMYIAMDSAKISQIPRVTGTICLVQREEALPELSH